MTYFANHELPAQQPGYHRHKNSKTSSVNVTGKIIICCQIHRNHISINVQAQFNVRLTTFITPLGNFFLYKVKTIL